MIDKSRYREGIRSPGSTRRNLAVVSRRGPVEGGTRSRVRSLSASVKAATACSRRSAPLFRLPRFKRAPSLAWVVLSHGRGGFYTWSGIFGLIAGVVLGTVLVGVLRGLLVLLINIRDLLAESLTKRG